MYIVYYLLSRNVISKKIFKKNVNVCVCGGGGGDVHTCSHMPTRECMTSIYIQRL